MIRAIELQANRPLHIHLPCRDRLWGKLADGQVRLRRHPLKPAQQIRDILLVGQYRAQSFELCLEIGNLRAECRKAPCRGKSSLDVGPHHRKLDFPLRDICLRGLHIEVPEDTDSRQ